MKKIIATTAFDRGLDEVPEQYKSAFFRKLADLAQESPFLDIKKMEPKNLGYYRLRIGKYRVIFEYPDQDTIRLLKIDSRDDIYR